MGVLGRSWWRELYDHDGNRDKTPLPGMTGRFSRRVRWWAKKENIRGVRGPRTIRGGKSRVAIDVKHTSIPVERQCELPGLRRSLDESGSCGPWGSRGRSKKLRLSRRDPPQRVIRSCCVL